ncbi:MULTISPECIES: sodium/proline symporter PutP [unclassified Oceanobacter]|uniref:sodium/proline symporter PutP n=2 Tax=Gammaproteobacteria TaxID=1236 RepID=UPI0026E322D2|nr:MULTISPECIES: sodium/proline symporter PutP [unclassified Oceanobacter]MDO6683190.1 sodium/proline symporter PutP [Oceanobacter sp. 5_MG-2023]MDP2506211.1 sodium/proline symporter PutP [Oceanobacter sp. 3_MG-2023]MDP2547248.1 sodium/proline symporter PutP [Oceanobacter sp. 4_MG-2023]MDP2610577.1 sodium/proline symporter PutP [Oceanobacter sp. 1_MG-2023]MDP2610640.1 sodium/proline symporter PutP [Oceanobacter sp. 2_MG-2023]
MVTLTFIVYLAVMLGIGIIAYRRTQDLSDYVLGGRNLGPIPSALSAGASDMSGWLLLGLPGYAMSAGYGAFWLAGGLLIGTWANWLLVAQRLRVYSQRAGDALTLPAFFEKRFEDKSHTLRVVSAIFVLVFFLFYTSSGLVAGGKLFETVFGLDYQLAVVLGAVAVISYTMFGGFLAVSWTDVVQGLLMVGAMVLVPVIALSEMGGISATFDKIANSNPELLDAFTNADGTPITLIGTLSLIGWGFGYFGQPHILARFKGIKSKDHVPAARRIAVAWTGVAMIGSMAIGLFAVAYLKTGLGDNETVFMVMVDAIFHPLVAGVLLAAILAAIMSTADSQLLVSSSALAEDFYKALFHKDASSEQLVKVGRFAVVGIAVIATVLALNPESGVLDLVSYAWAGFGAAFGPALILSLYWKRMTRQGALAGIVVGGITVVVWKQLEGGWFDLYEIIPGILLATLAVVVASMATREPEDSIQQKFDDVVTEVRS